MGSNVISYSMTINVCLRKNKHCSTDVMSDIVKFVIAEIRIGIHKIACSKRCNISKITTVTVN